MKKCFLIFVLLLIVQIVITAQPVVVAGNWNIIYENPDPNPDEEGANDFHICGIIESRDNVMPILKHHAEFVVGGGPPVPWYLEEYTIEKVAGHDTYWYFTVHFKTDGFISPGTMMHFGLYFITNYCNVAVINCAYWTYYKKAVGRMPLISFKVDNSQVNFMNTGEAPLILLDVELAVIKEPVPLEDMMTNGLGNPGEGGNDEYDIKWIKVPDEIAEILEQGIEPGAGISFHLEEIIQRNLKPGEFLQIRGNTLYMGNPVPWWLQHEEP